MIFFYLESNGLEPADSTFIANCQLTTSIQCPPILLSMFLLRYFCVIIYCLFEFKRICAGFLSFVHIGIAVRGPFIKKRGSLCAVTLPWQL